MMVDKFYAVNGFVEEHICQFIGKGLGIFVGWLFADIREVALRF